MTRRSDSIRAFTMIEVMIAMTLFSVMLVLVSTMFTTTNSTASLVGSMSDSQLEAERALELIRSELRTTTTDFSSDSSRQLSVTAAQAEYTRLDPKRLDLHKNIMVDGLAPEVVPWLGPSGETRVIRFELDAGEAGGAPNADDDGDLLVDEGRIALYTRVAGVDTLVAVLADNVRDGTTMPTPVDLFTLDSTLSRPRLWVTIVVERPIRAMLKNTTTLAAVRAGGGPVKRHTSRIQITLLN